MKKAVAIKLNDHYAKLTDGSCPSHHSPNDMIPLSNDDSRLWSGNLNHLLIKEGDIVICKIYTDLNVADPLTKPLPRAKHDHTLVLFGY